MKRLATLLMAGLVAVLVVQAAWAAATPVTGIIQNSREPWLVKDDRNRIFECRWVSGFNLFGRGDAVSLSDERGQVAMEGLSGPSKGKKAQVRVRLLP